MDKFNAPRGLNLIFVCGRSPALTIRKWAYLFWTTLLWGMGSAIAAGLILLLWDQEFTFFGLGFNVTTMLLGGATISVLTQMGFFAYLLLRMIMMGMIRKKLLWDFLQVFLIIVTLYELASIRYLSFGEGASFIRFFDLPAIILVISLAIALWKVKLTNRLAFLPTLFFMVVITVLEAVPALKLNIGASTFFMLTPLICCNAWQILILHKVLNNNKEKPAS